MGPCPQRTEPEALMPYLGCILMTLSLAGVRKVFSQRNLAMITCSIKRRPVCSSQNYPNAKSQASVLPFNGIFVQGGQSGFLALDKDGRAEHAGPEPYRK